jgi:hypothetical protein
MSITTTQAANGVLVFKDDLGNVVGYMTTPDDISLMPIYTNADGTIMTETQVNALHAAANALPKWVLPAAGVFLLLFLTKA